MQQTPLVHNDDGRILGFDGDDLVGGTDIESSRRVVAINRFYRPDHAATSQHLTDLAEHLAGEGRRVTVITSRLRYEGGGWLPAREVLDGVDIHRIWTTRFGRSNLLGRALDYTTFYLSAFFALLAIARRDDIVLAKTDPPLISVVAALAGRFKGFTQVNWCQDLFPEVAGALGLQWAGGWAGRTLKFLRNLSLKSAAFNAVLDDRMAERLLAEGVPSEQIRVLPNWADADIRPVAREDNRLRAEWGLTLDKFVIGYSGNLGRAHMPDKVAALVSCTRDVPGLVWLFIGGGAGIEKVRLAVAGADNVVFRPYQPRERLSESLSAPDLHLVSLDPGCEGFIVPSKLYGVLAVSRPALFLGAPDGSNASEIDRLGVGATLNCNAPDTWRPIVSRMVTHWEAGRRAQGSSAREDLVAHFRARRRLGAWSRALGQRLQGTVRRTSGSSEPGKQPSQN